MSEKPTKITVSDPFGAASDPELPSLKLALSPKEVKAGFKRGLPRLATEKGIVHPRAIRVVRHKPGRRCVIEYDIKVERDRVRSNRLTLIGKVRARRYGNEAYRLLDAIWRAGFQDDCPDGVSVPEPIGVIPEFQMWLQRKVPGQPACSRLIESDGVATARRIAEAIHKLHRAAVPTERSHTLADELSILHERLPLVAQMKADWFKRIERVLKACDELGAAVPPPRSCGIHRDFYSAQVMVDGSRLYLLDFDLYCRGDPALDVGNFGGHLIEQSLRTFGHPDGLADREQALEERFIELSGEDTRMAIRAYTTLTLVRHIYLSTQVPGRSHFTEALLELCEQRLANYIL